MGSMPRDRFDEAETGRTPRGNTPRDSSRAKLPCGDEERPLAPGLPYRHAFAIAYRLKCRLSEPETFNKFFCISLNQ